MHFFIDYNQITDQDPSDFKFGPDTDNPTNVFNLSTQFQLTAQNNEIFKAFACQAGDMIIQQSSGNTVNLIIKPRTGLKIPFGKVKYFVYRGLTKDSFISGQNIVAQGAENSEFIARFWTEWNGQNAGKNLPAPGPQSFGYDDSLSGSLDVEKIYDSSQNNNLRAVPVREGEWIGNFGTTISFEVIVETDNIFTLEFLRANKYQINVAGLSGLEERAKREQILSFIDPAAFFGLHYDEGVTIPTNSGKEKKKKENLYTSIISRFANGNNVYLDIRSEKGYSYNFYQNYKDNIGNNIKIGNNPETAYGWNSWPLVKIDNSLITTTGNKNNIKIKIRTNSNTKPIIFCQDKDVLKNSSSQFIEEKKILDTADWSKELTFVFPNTGSASVAHYIQLHYFRQEYNPSAVLENKTYFDSAFCPIDLPNLGDENYPFYQVHNSNRGFICGDIPFLSKNNYKYYNFGYVSTNGCHWDCSKIVFFAKALFPYKSTKHNLSNFKNKESNITGFNLDEDFNKKSFIARNIRLSQKRIQEDIVVANIATGNYQQVKLFDISNSNESPNSRESILCLGITQAEFQTLKSISGFSNQHHRYIHLEELNSSPFTDKDSKLFRKYKLSVQGLNSTNCTQLIKTPSTDIFVYSTSGLIFTSQAFANQETQESVYVRNYEENIGLIKNTQTTNDIPYEDYFIKDYANMKSNVDSFINALAYIGENAPDAYSKIKGLVEAGAANIWNEAVSIVQANNYATPDDRPLYWARNKMSVAIKSHPYFQRQFACSEVMPESELAEVIQIFEEKSRNYTGINFTAGGGTPGVTKKILITGFDPFQLDPSKQYSDIGRNNPSGICALALHGKLLPADTGYIQSAIFPVRYADFDNDVVENLVSTFLENNSVDMIVSLSLNGSAYYFDLERFAAKNRGGGSDNLNIGEGNPAFKQIIGKGNEFYETTLPKEKIITSQITHNFSLDKQMFFYDQSYIASNYRKHITEDIYQPNTNTNSFLISEITGSSIAGSGSHYLSNEIFYRIARARDKFNSSVKTGHFHLANQNPDLSKTPKTITPFTLSQIITETENAIKRCLNP